MNRYRWTIITPIKKMMVSTPENISGFSLGNQGCDIWIPLPEPIRIEGKKLLCGESMRICSPDGMATEAAIQPKRVLKVVAYDESIEYVRISMEKLTDGPDAWNRTLLLEEGSFSFGTKENCNVVYPAVGDYISRDFSLIVTGNKVSLRADDVLFGVYINQRRVKSGQLVELKKGDFAFSGSVSVFLGEGCLYTSAHTTVNGMKYHDSSEVNSHLEYPHMQRTARTHISVPGEAIEVLDPPAEGEKKQQNIFMSVLPSLISVLLIVAIRGNGSSDMSSILFSVATMAVGVVTSIMTFLTDQRDSSKKKQKRDASYKKYIEETTETIKARREKEKINLNNLYLDPARELQNVKDFSASLFDRVPEDSDFLDIRLGSGTIRSREPIKFRQHDDFTAMDALFYEPIRLFDTFEYQEGLPVVLAAKESNAIGVLGGFSAQLEMMRIMTLDLATRQYMDDVRLYYLVNDEFSGLMREIRLLPNVQNQEDGSRNIAFVSENNDELLEKLCGILAAREAGTVKMTEAPWLVIHIHSNETLIRHPLMKYVPYASKLHAVFIFWASVRENIPLGCTWEVRLFSNGNRGLLRNLEEETEDQLFTYETVSSESMSAASVRLAPVYTGEISIGTDLKSSCNFFETLGITGVKPENILKNWENAEPAKSLSVPIGVVSGDETLYLDLHEKADGPHGLVAGTTGSGKSEVIISYLMSLMYHFSPDEVNIVIIDFKGGGMGLQLQGVPHLTGLITNLEKHEIDRSLSSIKAELVHRQRVLADAGVSNINEYFKARKKNPGMQPLAHMLLVVDEFAELKQQQPEFMNELISAARIGRSLGVHLILSTQKPSGVVNDQIMSNMDFSMCLRVQNKSDSSEVIQSPLAAEIREPGRAYLKVSRQGTFCLFQSGYTGGSSLIDTEPEIKLDTVTLAGKRELLFRTKKEKATNAPKQFDVIKEGIIEAFAQSGKKLPMPICLPSLEKIIDYPGRVDDNPYHIPLALLDHPEEQTQYPYVLDLLEGNAALIGSNQMGKTTMLQTLVLSAAESMTARQMNIYVMDFNSGLFQTMSKLSIMGGVVALDDEEGIKNLLKMLRLEIIARKEKILDAEVISFEKYLDAGRDDLPAILLLVDNYTAFKEVYEEKYGQELLYILREGPAVGITTTVTSTQGGALGYKAMCYFTERIAFYSADSNEYYSVLEGCRGISLPEIPGRVLVKREKTVLTAQTYTFFGTLPEKERTERIHAFLEEHSGIPKARPIPGIPAVLTASFLENMCRGRVQVDYFPFAMDFASVEVVGIKLYRQFEFSLVNASAESVKYFVQLLSQAANRLPAGAHMHIVDNFEHTLENMIPNAEYSDEASCAPATVISVCKLAEERLKAVKEDGREVLEKEPLEIVVVNSAEAIAAISGDSKAWNAFAETEERRSNMRVLFIFTELANRQVSYSSPELLKHIRDNKKAAIFENAAKIHFFDTNLTEIRNNSQPLGRSDAITYGENGMTRVRMARP